MKWALAVCGPIGSGKSAVVDQVASEFGLKVVSFGGYVRAIAEQTGVSTARETLQDLGETLITSRGASGLLQAALEYAGVGNDDSVVFDGVRHVEILTEIRRSAETAVAVFLHVGLEDRYQRYIGRMAFGISYGEFVAMGNHPVEADIAKLADVCDLVIDAAQPAAEVQRILRNQLSLSTRPNG